MSTADTDIPDQSIADEDLAGIDESLHATVCEIYAATGHREFAITVAKNAERQLAKPELRFALLLNVVDAAIDAGISQRTQLATGGSIVELLDQLFPSADPWNELDAGHAWYELDTQLAKLADLPQLGRSFYEKPRFAVRLGQYTYAATGNSEFAARLAAAVEMATKGKKPALWQVIESAIAAGADLDTRMRCSNLRELLRYLNPDKDVDAEWSAEAKKVANAARRAEIVRALDAEFDDEFAAFLGRYLPWFDDKDATQLPATVGSVLTHANNECFDMDDVADALKRHVGIPGPIVDEAREELARRERAEERKEMLREIKGHYRDGQFAEFHTSGTTLSSAAEGKSSVPPAIWGSGTEVICPEGESTIIESGPGVGKTTIAGLLVRGMLFGGEVLGYPVRKLSDGQRILYLAMDRPQQIIRSLLRQFTPQQIEESEQLIIRQGTLPADAAENDHLLKDLADYYYADVLILDSVKDAALGLSEDRAAAIYQRGRQRLLQSGCQLLELHHLTKGGDAYGSIWLNAGVGSVVRLKGAAGGPTATLTQQKSPARMIDPIHIVHDRANGEMAVAPKRAADMGGCDVGESAAGATEPSTAGLPDWIAGQGREGVTSAQAADWLYGSSGRNDKVRAQRALNALCGDDGPLRYVEGSRGGDVKTPARWVGRSDD